jgi:hypothetical protein
MEDLSHDFDVLAERADDCGALWAIRSLRRLAADGAAPPTDWPGTIEEARRLVETFADRVGFAERENLASIVQHTAAWTWSDSIETAPPPPPLAGAAPRAPTPSMRWHLGEVAFV